MSEVEIKTHTLGVIIVAGGVGKRAARNFNSIPKQYEIISGKAILAHTIEAFINHDLVDWVLPVIGADHFEHFKQLQLDYPKLLPPVIGGAERQNSSLIGLRSLQEQAPDWVLIHDGARPFVSAQLVNRAYDALKSSPGVLPANAVTDTIKRSLDGRSIMATEDREQLWAAQTPQGFSYPEILAAHERAANHPTPFTDDAAIAEWAGQQVVLVNGDMENFKITTPQDFVRAEMFLDGKKAIKDKQMETRVGSGMDIHQFEPGTSVRLGGIDIPHTAKLKGHSDADAALHVLTDALLGALAEGDIGTHFPPNDAKWKGEPSDTFLAFAAKRVVARGGRIVHLDLTINCEAPKIGPVSAQIQKNIAQICQISPNRVSVKATTSEKMGFVGREEGLMALGTATIEIPRGEN